MSNAFTRHLKTANETPQTTKARPDQIQNDAGGYVFQVKDKARLERFLVLGTDGGTFYVSEQKLTERNLDFLVDLIHKDEELVWDTIHEVSTAGRAYRQSPAIFALALLFQHGKVKDEPLVKREKTAVNLLQSVCRTLSHLYEWSQYMRDLGKAAGKNGYSSASSRAVRVWFQSRSPEDLTYQAIKYRSRYGHTVKDMVKLGHPTGIDPQVYSFMLDKQPANEPYTIPILSGFNKVQQAETNKDVLSVLGDFPNLPWEALPTSAHKNADVWKKLFSNGQLKGQALLRNIVRLAKLNAFNDMEFASAVAEKLVDEEMIRKTRLHPIQYLLALVNYTDGQMDRKRFTSFYGHRTKDWIVNPVVRDALDAGFYLAFKYADSADKKTLVGLDVSSSMSALAMGIDLSCAEVGAAISMATVRREPFYQVMGFAYAFKDLGITPKMSLQQVLAITRRQNFGSTDCSLPMKYAMQHKLDVDTFVVMTDNETWAGQGHPFQELRKYRQFVGHDAKLIVLAMTATNSTIADPTDPGMLDICGADSNVPAIVADFSAGRI